jgi:hypothetical protein
MVKLHEVSGGNPFYALELARALEARVEDLKPTKPLPVPRELDTLVRERIAALPTETQAALLFCASLSRADLGLVSKATGRDAHLTLEAAENAQVVELKGSEIRFTHPLLAAGVYASAARTRRAEVHRVLAEVVDDVEDRARHLAVATEAPDDAVALALDQAAQTAFSRGAPHAAADLSARARDMTPPDKPDAIRKRAVTEADYALHAGDPARARERLEEVLAAVEPGSIRADPQPPWPIARLRRRLDLVRGLLPSCATRSRWRYRGERSSRARPRADPAPFPIGSQRGCRPRSRSR